MADATKWGIYQDILVQQNTDYTFSIDVKKQLWMECRALTTTTSANGTITPTGIVSGSGWDEEINSNDYNYDNRRFAKTFNTGNYKAYRFFFYGYYAIDGALFNKAGQINHPQLELGTKATDWTPSPLDSQEEIQTKTSKDDVLNTFYPVGSYYETSDASFDPNTAWGGIWELETAGQVHVSSGTGYTVSGALTNTTDGGEATHVLTASETGIRNHTHTYSDYNTTYTLKTTNRKPGTSTAVAYGTGLTAGGGATTRTSNNPASEASGAAHNNMQPYIVVNRWHRTA